MSHRDVSLWVDPMDPWGWVVARWLKNADTVLGSAFKVRILSVALLNEGTDIPEQYRDDIEAFENRMRQSLGPVRLLSAVEQEFGADALKKLYFALAHQIHVVGVSSFDVAIEPALQEAGLPARLEEATRTDAHDEHLRRSHREGMNAVKIEAGSPILQIGEATFFGPVMSRAPQGQEAADLLHAMETLASHGVVYELKSYRQEEPVPS